MPPAPVTPRHDRAAVACRALTKQYRSTTGVVTALTGLDADFPAGRVTVVRGASGSGKTSLLRILACSDRPTSGSVWLGGVDVAALAARHRRRLRRRLVGYVHQRPSHNLLPYLTAEEQLWLAAGLRGSGRGAVAFLLDSLGLGDRARHRPDEMSGGEQQRLALAAAVIGGPALVVADEPTAELDAGSAAGVVAALRSLAGAGVTMVVSSHDEVVAAGADAVVTLDHGAVIGVDVR